MRIFYAISNEWFINNEVDSLVKRGHKVYIPRMGQVDVFTNVEAAKKYSCKNELPDVIEKYRYGEEFLGRDAIELINEHFDMVIMDYNKYLLQGCLMFCNIDFVLRPLTYFQNDILEQKIIDDLGYWAIKLMERKWRHFHISTFMKKTSRFIDKFRVDMPFFMTKKEIKLCPDGNILGIFNQLKTNNDSYLKCKQFCDNFNDLPHIAKGKQLIPVGDKKDVVNIELDSGFDKTLARHSVLYYERIEDEFPVHVFEAFSLGVPVIYMKDSIIDLFSKRTMTGACDSIDECKRKCKKALRNKSFYKRIVQDQFAYIEDLAIRNDRIINNTHFTKCIGDKINAGSKVGIIVPTKESVLLEYSISFAKALKKGAELLGEKTEFVFACVEDIPYCDDSKVNHIYDAGIGIRRFKWEEIDGERGQIIYRSQGHLEVKKQEKRIIANDSIRLFEECDCIIYMSDQIPGYIFATHPYAIVLDGYMRKYLLGNYSRVDCKYSNGNARFASVDFALSTEVLNQAIQKGGIERSKVIRLPLMLNKVENVTRKPYFCKAINYFTWVTDASLMKNHIHVFEALVDYYESGGECDCVLIGNNMDIYEKNKMKCPSNEYQEIIKNIIKGSRLLKKHMHILGDMNRDSYINLLQNSKFVFKSDNISVSLKAVIDSAMLGVKSLCIEDDLLKRAMEELPLNISFYDGQNSCDLLCKLKEMDHMDMAVTKNECLLQHTIDNEELCMSIYRTIRNYLPI